MDFEKRFNGREGLGSWPKRMTATCVDDKLDGIAIFPQGLAEGDALTQRNEAIAIAVNQ